MSVVVPVDLVVDLVDAGLLHPNHGEDRVAIARAIERFIGLSRVTAFPDEL